jgi:hypothetical protein
MATRKLVLGSAASLLISSAVIAAAPVLAQSSDPALAYSAATAQYEAELRDYNQKQQAYERERGEYSDRINDYQRSLNAPLPSRMPDVVVVEDNTPDVVVVDNDADTVVVADPDDDIVVLDNGDDFTDRLIIDVPPSALMRLEDAVDVNDEFFNVPVLDAAGLTVGHFRRIETKEPGDLVAVITLDSRRTISVLTEHVRLDPRRRTIIADLTAREIDRIPSGFPYG